MTILTALKRTTAIAALAALPLAPVSVLAESAQATGTQPPAAAEEAATPTTTQQTAGQVGTTDAEATQTQGEPGQSGTQSGQAPDQAQQGSTDQAQQQETGQTGEQATQTQGDPGQSGTQSGQAPEQATDQSKAGGDEDTVVAKVGDREIRRSDVLTVIGLLPPQLQQQPPEMLIPIALDQLVMRELILQKAKEAGLENDPAVTSLAEDASERAKEDAMVQVWLDQELGKAVTEDKVQETYDTVKQQLGDQAPTIDVLRPQIEQELRQEAFLDISEDLQANAEVTLYGPDGQALTQ